MNSFKKYSIKDKFVGWASQNFNIFNFLQIPDCGLVALFICSKTLILMAFPANLYFKSETAEDRPTCRSHASRYFSIVRVCQIVRRAGTYWKFGDANPFRRYRKKTRGAKNRPPVIGGVKTAQLWAVTVVWMFPCLLMLSCGSLSARLVPEIIVSVFHLKKKRSENCERTESALIAGDSIFGHSE